MRKVAGLLSLLWVLCGSLSAQVSYSSAITNLVKVTYNASSTATVVVASNLQSYVTATVSGGAVSIVQNSTVGAATCGEIIYLLGGSSANGSFYMEGSYKATIELDNLTLTNPQGPAFNIQNGKRIELKLLEGTVNTVKDGTSSATDAWKAALYCKGHLELKGRGTLNVYGNYAHAIYSKEYMSIKNCTINVCSAVKDALHCREYFLMESGKVSLRGFASDGIECNIDGTLSTGETLNHEDEDSGNIYILGGSLTIDMSHSSGNSLKADGTQTINPDAMVNVSTNVDLVAQTEGSIEVYNLLGTYIGRFDTMQGINSLPRGIYVIKNSNLVKKVNIL